MIVLLAKWAFPPTRRVLECGQRVWKRQNNPPRHRQPKPAVSVAIAAVIDRNAIRYAFLRAYISEPRAASVNITDNTSSSHSAPEHTAAH